MRGGGRGVLQRYHAGEGGGGEGGFNEVMDVGYGAHEGMGLHEGFQ